MSKVCSKCKAEREPSEFCLDRSRRDGIHPHCIHCRRQKARNYYVANKPRLLAQSKAWIKKNKERHRALCVKSSLALRLRDPMRASRYYLANREKIIRKTTAYRKANPEIAAAIYRNRRARIKGNGGIHTASDILGLLIKQEHRCAICDLVLVKYHVDHMMPIKLGGSNDVGNLQILCPQCNVRKNARHPDVYRKMVSGR